MCVRIGQAGGWEDSLGVVVQEVFVEPNAVLVKDNKQ